MTHYTSFSSLHFHYKPWRSGLGNYPAITQAIESPHERADSRYQILAQRLVGLTVPVVLAPGERMGPREHQFATITWQSAQP